MTIQSDASNEGIATPGEAAHGSLPHVLKGSVHRITFRNPSNGYSVLDVQIEGESRRITVVGPCVHINESDNIVAKGRFSTHPKFGEQFTATVIDAIAPSTSEEIARYLGSGQIKGIGPATAKRIVEALGDDTLEVIYKNPKRLARVPGIGKHKAELIQSAFAEQSILRRIMQFLISHRVSPNLANKIYSRYGDSSVEILTSDPYILARDIKGVGFRTADFIATSGLGIALNSRSRLRAGLIYALEKATEDGHCFLPEGELFQRATALLRLSLDENRTVEESEENDGQNNLNSALESLITEERLIREDDALYLGPIYRAEQYIASFIASRIDPLANPAIPIQETEQSIASAATSLGVTFSHDQESAVIAATRHPLLVITGGPGCGKTTIIKAVSYVFRKAGKKLVLAAPTGRAAQRMAQVCEFQASTIHRLLRFQRGSFEHGPQNPIDADAIVIDEASMVDIFLAKSLFSAIPAHCVLILVGDKDQLPSVGAGRIFADLIGSPAVKTVTLSQLFRRESESTINYIAHSINCGVVPSIPEPDGITKVDAYFLQQKEPEDAALLVERLVADQIPKKFGFEINDIMVLTPSNRGPLGVEALNQRLQARINPPGAVDESQELQLESGSFRLRDRVVQRVNNYQIHENGVFNGDSGIVYTVDRKSRSLKVDLWDGRIIPYTDHELSQLMLAYAMTVHRSQGSEIPCVVLILHDSHYTMLERQLVYTAVTRAKKLLIIVGTRRALAIASKRTTARDRHTNLQRRIGEMVVKKGESIVVHD